ncbi:MAG: zinc ribbon domain-containing protein [Chloroflexota bacterium]|nr:zinc ribbon domain-containing protein [Chloroflexota bacterium]
MKGRVHVPRPVEEHITVASFCEPIFTAEQMSELRQVAREIERTPSRELASQHLLSGLVFCTCGTKMYGVSQYTNTKLGRYRSVYYRCRRASAQGTCSAKQIPASLIEPLLMGELWKLRLNPEALDDMAGEATGAFEEQMHPLLKRAEESVRETQRVERRLEALLELAEERLIGKDEYATRRTQLEAELIALHAAQHEAEQEIAARAQPGEEIRGVLASLERLLDVFESLEEIGERRRLLQQCLSRVVVRQESLEVHVMADPVILPPDDSAAELLNISPKIPGKVHLTSAEGHRERRKRASFRGDFPGKVHGVNGKSVGVDEHMDAHAGTTATRCVLAFALSRWSRGIRSGSADLSWTASTCICRLAASNSKNSPAPSLASRRGWCERA